jgi:transcription elongation factor GreA
MSKLTRSGYQKKIALLESEKKRLAELAKNRAEAYSRDGDGTHDNPSFHLLTSDYEVLYNQIKILEDSLKEIDIIEEKAINCKTIDIGSVVELLITNLSEPDNKEEFQIVDPIESSPDEGKISFLSPIGQMLLGLKVGDTCKLEVMGNEYIYEVIQIKKTFNNQRGN